MGLVFMFVMGGHFFLVTMPAVAGIIMLLILDLKAMPDKVSFFSIGATAALLTMAVRFHWILSSFRALDKIGVWEANFKLFWNMPLLLTALPIPVLVGMRFLFPRARLWASGLLLGALLSFALHIVIILSLGTQLYRWYQITTVY